MQFSQFFWLFKNIISINNRAFEPGLALGPGRLGGKKKTLDRTGSITKVSLMLMISSCNHATNLREIDRTFLLWVEIRMQI